MFHKGREHGLGLPGLFGGSCSGAVTNVFDVALVGDL